MKQVLNKYIVALAVASISYTASLQAAEEKPLPVFVFAGQSNMAGMRAKVEDLPETERGEIPGVSFFDGEKWVPLKPGANQAKGFGPEISFARKYSADIKEPIGIIKHSKGGSLLASHWSPTSQSFNLYKELLAKVQKAGETRPIKVVGVIWMQGESDGVNDKRAGLYPTNLVKLIEGFRTEFKNPDLTFVCGRVNPPLDKFPASPAVRKAQEECAASKYAWINLDDLPKGSDNLHYNTAGLVEMGKRFEEATVKLQTATTQTQAQRP